MTAPLIIWVGGVITAVAASAATFLLARHDRIHDRIHGRGHQADEEEILAVAALVAGTVWASLSWLPITALAHIS